MKIAILVGVSKYDNLTELNACKNDVNIMKLLLDNTNEYDDILFIDEKTNSSSLKDCLFEYIKSKREDLESKKIQLEEVLFYYSGHGTYREDEFYYTTSDFDIDRLRTTCIENSELDDALRSLNPKLTIKIVDACECGTRYIKNSQDIDFKCLDSSKGKFNDCYFLYSSHVDQSSMAGKSFSYFTQVLIQSIINRDVGNIRYRDIVAYISDKFKQLNTKQEPYYIIQSSNTEVFCNVTNSLQRNLREFIKKICSEDGENQDKEGEDKSLIDIIKQDAQNYCEDIDEVNNLLINIKSKIEEIDSSYENLNSIYELNINPSKNSLSYIKNIESVAKSIRIKDDNYFIKYNYETRKLKEKVRNPFYIGVFPLSSSEDKYKYETVTKSVICGYEITEESVPYYSLSIEANPKLSNINKYTCCLVYAFSRARINIYYCFNTCYESSWGVFENPKNKEWSEVSFLIKDTKSLESSIEKIKQNFLSYIYGDLTKKFKTIEN